MKGLQYVTNLNYSINIFFYLPHAMYLRGKSHETEVE